MFLSGPLPACHALYFGSHKFLRDDTRPYHLNLRRQSGWAHLRPANSMFFNVISIGCKYSPGSSWRLSVGAFKDVLPTRQKPWINHSKPRSGRSTGRANLGNFPISAGPAKGNGWPATPKMVRTRNGVTIAIAVCLKLNTAGLKLEPICTTPVEISGRSELCRLNLRSEISPPRRPVILFPAVADASEVFIRDVDVDKFDASAVFVRPERQR